MRDILVYGALRTSMTSEDLKKRLLSDTADETQIKNAHLLGDLGRLVILQNQLAHDDLYGEKLLSQAHRIQPRSEEHTSELQSRFDLVCRLLLEKKKKKEE